MKQLVMSSASRLFILCLSLFMLASCGGSDDSDSTDNSQTGQQSESILMRSCSIAEGEEVVADDVSVITLEYNATVKTSPSVAITLNGTAVTAKSNPQTAMKLDISVSLEPGKQYTLSVPSGAVIDTKDAKRTAKAFTLTFKTRSKTQSGAYADLCDTKATDATRNLYEFIKEQYGRKIMSAVIANVNWNNQEAEKIYKMTGKYPLFNCYDFIQIYVPKGNGWINYDDITPVTSWASAGGLVQMMWHFNVPKTENTKLEMNGSGVTCTPSETTFKGSNALKEGTWENKYFYEQMNHVCDILLRLQEQNIAIVWRPFHEAAGNATLKSGASWGKAWFWWGYEGAEVHKQLWIAMYEHFQKRGVHNLIWVWTTQNYNCDKTQYNNDANWYPGDKYVDIIGRDLYGQSAQLNAQEYKEITERYPNKIVTLSECGMDGSKAFAKVSDIWNAGARWSWFMPWYGSNMPDAAWWTDALNNANVLTR